MPKLKIRNSFFKPVHFQTFLFTVAYLLLSKFIFLKSIASGNLFISFFGPFTFGIVTTLIFLIFFNHEDFFHFIKGIESNEKKTEKKFLKKYYHHSKVLMTIIIGSIGGPFFLALTIRLLINKFAYKYPVMIIAVLISTLVSVGLAKGFISLW
jgi:hypothetical protein